LTFNDFNLHPDIFQAVQDMGYKSPTPIQQIAIPAILEGKDVIGSAQTGTGKTAAFLIPILNNILKINEESIKCLIIAPTRELALQIDQQAEALKYYTSISSVAVYGGNQPEEWEMQKSGITKKADIVICTPGRLISHINLGYVDFSKLNYLILDEADRMLDMGFYEDLMKIYKVLPPQKQTLLFSATFAPKLRALSAKFLHNPVNLNIAIAKPAEGIKQTAYLVYERNKIKLLENIIKNTDVKNMLIFASRKTSVDEIYRALIQCGINAKNLHSGKEQTERIEILRQFKNGQLQCLVATDVLSRGIDIEGLSHVLNYDIPNDPADYVHRIGRTARADAKGEAITFISESDSPDFFEIEKLTQIVVEKKLTPSFIGESPAYTPDKIYKNNSKKHFNNKFRNRRKNKENK
jgi:ATP-dependent RNA helicase RhlE